MHEKADVRIRGLEVGLAAAKVLTAHHQLRAEALRLERCAMGKAGRSGRRTAAGRRTGSKVTHNKKGRGGNAAALSLFSGSFLFPYSLNFPSALSPVALALATARSYQQAPCRLVQSSCFPCKSHASP